LNIKDSTQFNLWNKIYDLVPPQNAHLKLKYEIEKHCEGGNKCATIKKKEIKTSENQLNKILNKYPYLPFILGFSLLAILIIDLVNYYK